MTKQNIDESKGPKMLKHLIHCACIQKVE